MNREEALHIFNHSEEIVSADAVNASISKMADAIRAEIGDAFPLVLSVMGGAAVFTGCCCRISISRWNSTTST